MFGNTIGPAEIGIVLVIALLIFGPKKLPELGKGLGRGMRDFKRAPLPQPRRARRHPPPHRTRHPEAANVAA